MGSGGFGHRDTEVRSAFAKASARQEKNRLQISPNSSKKLQNWSGAEPAGRRRSQEKKLCKKTAKNDKTRGVGDAKKGKSRGVGLEFRVYAAPDRLKAELRTRAALDLSRLPPSLFPPPLWAEFSTLLYHHAAIESQNTYEEKLTVSF
jgi:hypothetical protein